MPTNAGKPAGRISFNLIRQMPAIAFPFTILGVKGAGTIVLAISGSMV
jgi:hypothetical protein